MEKAGTENLKTFCSSCGKESQLKCSKCKLVSYCEVSCQKKDWGSHKGECRLYDVITTKDMGKGLVARRDLIPGEIAIREKPIILVKTPNHPKTIINHVAELRTAVRMLSEEDTKVFCALDVSRPELIGKDQGDIRNLGIFNTNAIALKQMDKMQARDIGAAVFPNISRINHACSPNVVWSYNQVNNMEEVRVVRNIKAGEELLACYTDPLPQREERRQFLKAKFNFCCYCEVCSLSGESLKENEKIRKEILGLKNNMRDIYRENSGKALRFAKMRVERMEKQRGELIGALPQAYMDCYELALAEKEEEIANIYKKRGKDVAKIVRGENSLWSHVK